MTPNLVALTNAAELLQKVTMLADEDMPDRLGAIVFRFDTSTLILMAVADDDTLMWGTQEDLAAFPIELDASIWQRFISHAPFQFWEMTCHKGYFDGFQITFHPTDDVDTVQLMVAASAISIHFLQRVYG